MGKIGVGRQEALQKNEQDRVNLLKKIDLFVLDMDGTFYLGNHVIKGALDFVQYVQKK